MSTSAGPARSCLDTCRWMPAPCVHHAPQDRELVASIESWVLAGALWPARRSREALLSLAFSFKLDFLLENFLSFHSLYFQYKKKLFRTFQWIFTFRSDIWWKVRWCLMMYNRLQFWRDDIRVEFVILNWIFEFRDVFYAKTRWWIPRKVFMSCEGGIFFKFSFSHAIFVSGIRRREARQFVDSTDDDGYLIYSWGDCLEGGFGGCGGKQILFEFFRGKNEPWGFWGGFTLSQRCLREQIVSFTVNLWRLSLGKGCKVASDFMSSL